MNFLQLFHKTDINQGVQECRDTENAILLDVRTAEEYREGHIPGSININVLDDQFETVADSLLQKGRPVALYCRSGKRSKKAAKLLSQKGYEVYELQTGFQGWQQAGKTVER